MTLAWSDPNADPLADMRALWRRHVTGPAHPSSEDQLRAAIDRAAQQYADLNGFPADRVGTSAGEAPSDRFAAPHVCDYTAGFCRLPGVHGGVPDPEPHTARPDDFTVSASSDGDLELRCAHYGLGCWWTMDLTNEDTLAVLLLCAREHVAAEHVRVVDGTVELSVVPNT